MRSVHSIFDMQGGTWNGRGELFIVDKGGYVREVWGGRGTHIMMVGV